jgi:hypothetical protein
VSVWSDDGFMAWRILRTRPQLSSPWRRSVTDHIFGYRATLCLVVCRLVCAALLLFRAAAIQDSGLLVLLILTGAALQFRHLVSGDGSDQMINIVLVGLLVSTLSGGTLIAAGFGFIAFQSILSYLTSGIVKAISPIWRTGDAVSMILRTQTYGTPRLAFWLSQRPGLDKFLAWGVIAFETMFPMALLLPTPAFIAILGLGVVFHLTNAVVMGLNVFFWAFVSTYPSLIYLHSRVWI